MIDPVDPGTYVRLDALRVGIVDDNAYFRKLAETMLGAFGVRVILQAATEAEALTMVMTQSPDVLLLDWNLGTAGNGAALLDLLRRHPDERVSTLAVVMVTAYADKRRMLAAVDLGATTCWSSRCPRDASTSGSPSCRRPASFTRGAATGWCRPCRRPRSSMTDQAKSFGCVHIF